MKRKVYVINKGCHDYSPAKRFGDLIFLTHGMINPLSVGRMYREMEVFLRHSSPDDYLLPTGFNIMCMVATSIFSHMHGRLNLLIYHTAKNGNKAVYKERTIKL
jgi:hypothetical protein